MTKRKRTNNDQQSTTSIQKTTDQPTQTRIIWFYKIVHHLVAIPSILIPADSRTRKTQQQTFRHIFTSKDTYRYSFFPYKSHNGTIFQNPAYKLKQFTHSENSSHLLFSAHSFKNPH